MRRVTEKAEVDGWVRGRAVAVGQAKPDKARQPACSALKACLPRLWKTVMKCQDGSTWQLNGWW